jgi:hypothetical protein
MNILKKQECINEYNKLVDAYYKEYYYLVSIGEAQEDCGDSNEAISTPEQIVGYYFSWYKDEAFDVWNSNIKDKTPLSELDIKTTSLFEEILK